MEICWYIFLALHADPKPKKWHTHTEINTFMKPLDYKHNKYGAKVKWSEICSGLNHVLLISFTLKNKASKKGFHSAAT